MDNVQLQHRFHELEAALSPLMQLVCTITTLETAFVTYIDPVQSKQLVAVTFGDDVLNIAAGSEVEWQDSMCRKLFNDDAWMNNTIAQSYPYSAGAKLGMATFFALPVQYKNSTIGSLCGASKEYKEMTEAQLTQLQLIASAVSWLIAQWQRLLKLQQRLQLTRLRLQRVKEDRESLKQLAGQDPLTGLLNRRGFADLWQSCTEQDAREGEIAVVALDFDNFKQLNDNFGHQAGDDALSALGQILQQHIRDYDFAARLGGDEFLLVLPGCKRLEAVHIAERIQLQYRQTAYGQFHTISVGIAVSKVGAFDDVILLADKALYKAKNAGRGQIMVRVYRSEADITLV